MLRFDDIVVEYSFDFSEVSVTKHLLKGKIVSIGTTVTRPISMISIADFGLTVSRDTFSYFIENPISKFHLKLQIGIDLDRRFDVPEFWTLDCCI